MSTSYAANNDVYETDTSKIMQEIDSYLEEYSSDNPNILEKLHEIKKEPLDNHEEYFSDNPNIPEKLHEIKKEPLDNHDTVAFDVITPNQSVYKQFTKNSTVMDKKNTNNPIDNFSFVSNEIGNIKDDITPNQNVYKQFIKTMDTKNTNSPQDNFSFALNKIGYIQEDVIQKANGYRQFTKNSTAMEIKNTNNPIDNFSFVSDKNGNIQNYEQIANQKNLDTSSNENNSGFQKEFQQNSQNNDPFSLLSKDNNYSLISPLTQPCSSKLQFNIPLFENLKQQPKTVQGKYQLGHNMPFGLNNNEFKNSNIGNHKPVFNHFQVPYPPSTNRSPEEDINGPHSLNSYDLNRQVQNKQHFNLPDHKFKQRANLSHYGNKQKFYMPHHENKQNLNVPRLENKQNFNWPHHENMPILNSPFHENKQNSDYKRSDSSSMPIRQDYLHVSNLQSTETSHTQTICFTDNVFLRVVKDNLHPESLNGSTIKFSTRKLVNSSTRDELVIALNKYGALEFSWWTPDDFLFARYISSYNAQHVYQMYKK